MDVPNLPNKEKETDEISSSMGGNLEKAFDTMPQNLRDELKTSIEIFQHQNVINDTYLRILDDINNGELSNNYEQTVEKAIQPEVISTGIDENKEEFYKTFISDSFKGDILRMALIEKIHLDFNSVAIHFPEENPFDLKGPRYYIPSNLFSLYWEGVLNDSQKEYFSNCIFRGESCANWREEDERVKGNYFVNPIVVSNQDYDKSNLSLINGVDPKQIGLDYLSCWEEANRREFYIAGSISHEIGHNIYWNLIKDKDLEAEWKEIVDNIGGNITAYARYYERLRGIRNYDENFAEAVRIYTTSPGYFDVEGYSGIKQFLKSNFPQIIEKESVSDDGAKRRTELLNSLRQGNLPIKNDSSNELEINSNRNIGIGSDGTIIRPWIKD